jgi:hypothetical protein
MDEDMEWDLVREAVFAVVREGEEEAVALIDGVEANVAERERLWLWLTVEDPDSDRVVVEDTTVVGETLELGLEDTVVL